MFFRDFFRIIYLSEKIFFFIFSCLLSKRWPKNMNHLNLGSNFKLDNFGFKTVSSNTLSGFCVETNPSLKIENVNI